MDEKITLLDLSFNTQDAIDGLDALIKRSIELAGTKKELTAALKLEEQNLAKTTEAFKAGLINQDAYNAALDNSVKAQVAIKKSLLDVSKEVSDNTSSIKANKTIVDADADSVESLRARLALNTKELGKMTAAQIETSQEGQQLTEQTKALSDRLKGLEKSWGDNRRNVGNYAEGVEEAIKSTGGLSGATGQLVGGLSNGVTSVKAFNGALKANPIAGVISIVLLLMNSIEKLMGRNDEMSTNLKAAFAPFATIFDRLMDGITGLMEGVLTVIGKVAEGVTWLLDKLGLIGEETKKAAASANALAKEAKAIFEAETDQIVPLAAITRKYEELKLLAADQNRTMGERAELNKRALSELDKMQAMEVKLLERKRDQLVAENKLSYTNAENRRAEMQAIAAVDAKQAEYSSKRKEVLAQMTGLEKTARDAADAANAKAVADRTAREKKAHDDSVKAAADAEKAKKTIIDGTLKDMDANIVKLQLHYRELSVGVIDKQAALEAQDAINEELLSKEKYRLQQGLITKTEFDNKALEYQIVHNEKLAEINKEAADKADEIKKNRDAVNAANKAELEMANAASDNERQIIQLESKRATEIAAAEALGADTTLIYEKYEKMRQEIDRKGLEAKLAGAANLAGQLSTLLGDESDAGKAFAVAQATINTYLGASKAIAQGGFWGIAQAAVVIGAGLKQVANIVKVKKPDTEVKKPSKTFAKGGEIVGASHAAGGVRFTSDNGQSFEAEGGENLYIINKKATKAINALSALNEANGGASFAKSGMYKYADGGQIASLSRTSQSANISFANEPITLSDKSLTKLANALSEALESAPAPIVSVVDINDVQRNVRVVENYASL